VVLCYACSVHAFSEEAAAAEGIARTDRLRGFETRDDSPVFLRFSL
jgi:hypothetical protein